MSLISEQDQKQLIEMFEGLPEAVEIHFFRAELDCMYCDDTQAILEELLGLSERTELAIHHQASSNGIFDEYKIDKVPAIALKARGQQDAGIRYFGIPSGYEFSSLIEDILMVSQGDSGLSPESRSALGQLTEPVHLQVFVTPTCPYCPAAVRLAHQMALESPMVTADMVEATEFPALSQKYGVMGVPRTVINESDHVEGAVPEAMLLPKVLAGGAN